MMLSIYTPVPNLIELELLSGKAFWDSENVVSRAALEEIAEVDEATGRAQLQGGLRSILRPMQAHMFGPTFRYDLTYLINSRIHWCAILKCIHKHFNSCEH